MSVEVSVIHNELNVDELLTYKPSKGTEYMTMQSSVESLPTKKTSAINRVPEKVFMSRVN